MQNILYIFNSNKDKRLEKSKQIISFLKEKDFSVYTDNSNLASKLQINLVSKEDLKNMDISIVLGGDGTILKYARNYGEYQIPILGINIGRVGALAIANMNDYQNYIEMYLNGQYSIIKHLTLNGCINFANGDNISFVFYNELILHRGLSLKLLPINISVNDSKYDRVYGDGVIVSTPIGSSAYNLSAGGPLLTQDSHCYVITPICSQTRGFASLVVSEKDKVSLLISDTTDELMVSIDGCEKFNVGIGDKIDIYKSDINLNLLQFVKHASLYGAVYKVIASINRKGEK